MFGVVVYVQHTPDECKCHADLDYYATVELVHACVLSELPIALIGQETLQSAIGSSQGTNHASVRHRCHLDCTVT